MSNEIARASAAAFEGVTPILRVRSVAASLEYYVQKLGFKIDWQAPFFASVSRGRCHIFLSEGDRGNLGGWAWIGVEDADALFEEYRASGAKVRHPPTNYDWAYEMQVEDPDGNILRMGSDQKQDEPIGEWLDMQGRRWTFEGGEWVRAD
jgi:catechol 2,3-dioxygenase-like lactoylglutathione lyase family enzyme